MFSATKKDDEKSKTLVELAVYLNCTEEMLTKTLSDEVLINFRSKLFKIPKLQTDSFVETLSPTQQQRYSILKARFDQLDSIDKVKSAKDDTPTTLPPATGGGLFTAAYNLVSNGVSYVTGGGSPTKPTAPAKADLDAPANEDWVHVDEELDAVKKRSLEAFQQKQREQDDLLARAAEEEQLKKETKRPDDLVTPGAPVEDLDAVRRAQEEEQQRIAAEQLARELEEQRVREEQLLIAAEQLARELEEQRVREEQQRVAAEKARKEEERLAKIREEQRVAAELAKSVAARTAVQQHCGAAFHLLSAQHQAELQETFSKTGSVKTAPTEARRALILNYDK